MHVLYVTARHCVSTVFKTAVSPLGFAQSVFCRLENIEGEGRRGGRGGGGEAGGFVGVGGG